MILNQSGSIFFHILFLITEMFQVAIDPHFDNHRLNFFCNNKALKKSLQCGSLLSDLRIGNGPDDPIEPNNLPILLDHKCSFVPNSFNSILSDLCQI